MLYSQRMVKLRIYVHKKYVKTLIDKLHSLGVLHIEEHKKTDDLDIGESMIAGNEIAEQLVAIRSIIDYFKLDTKLNISNLTIHNVNYQKQSFSDIKNGIKRIQQLISSLENKKQDLQKIIENKREVLEQLDILTSLYLDLESYQSYKTLSMFVGFIDYDPKIRNDMAELTSQHKLHISQNGKRQVMALFLPRKYELQAEEILKTYNFSPAAIDKVQGMKGSPLGASNKLKAEEAFLNQEKEAIDAELQKHARQNKQFLLTSYKYLETESKKAMLPLHFGQTKHINILTGYVPKESLENTISSINNVSKNSAYIEQVEITQKDKVPVNLKHSRLVTPFEFFLNLYSLPKYKEIDPTSLIFFTFPLFFGIMLGDVVYGIITLLLFRFLKTKINSPNANKLLSVMMFASLATIAFGFVFGEYMGFESVNEEIGYSLKSIGLPLHAVMHEGNTVYEFPRLLNRLHGEMELFGYSINTVLIIGAIIGFIHINLGLLMGFLNELSSHGFKHAFFAKISWIVLQLGAVLLISSLQGAVNLHWGVGAGILALSVIMLFIGEGIIGLIEIPGLLSNILSYLRLGAVALASVGLAVVINEQLAGPFLHKGGVYILLGVVILIMGHAVNIALGVIGPFLHSLRLHYVEYFTKFFHGGGIPYAPFGVNEKSIKKAN